MPRTLQATRHFHVAQALREQVKRLAPGTEIDTVKQLMLEFGTSQATIERAMTQLRREGLVSRPAGKQRLVVSSISDPATRRIALIRPDYPSRVFDEVTRSIVNQGRDQDAKFDLIHYRSLATLDLAHLTQDADAAVLVPTSEAYPDHLRAAIERPRKPLVLTQEIPPRLKAHGVHLDNARMSRMAVEYLVSIGHRRILYFDNEPPTYSCAARREAWRGAMVEAGLEAGDDRVCDCRTPYGADSLESAYQGFRRWMVSPACEFTAIFVSTSTVAGMAVMRVLHEHGLTVPGDVSIISYSGEDTLAAYTNPALSTLELDMSAYGLAVSQLLDELFRDPGAARRQIDLVPTLVVRDSTAAPGI